MIYSILHFITKTFTYKELKKRPLWFSNHPHNNSIYVLVRSLHIMKTIAFCKHKITMKFSVHFGIYAFQILLIM